MELAIVAGIVIVAIVAITGGGSSQTAPPPPVPDNGSAGNLSGIGGPAVQLLQEQPSSSAGQSGSGSLAPSGPMPPVATRQPIVMPRQPIRVPINIAAAPRVRTQPAPAPRVNYMGTHTKVTFHQS